MNVQTVRSYCLSLPHVTENVQWGEHLCFRIANKIFAIVAMDAAPPNRMSIKTTPERFAELCERDGFVPAPYFAHARWIAVQAWDAAPASEMKQLIRSSYDLIKSKLPKKLISEFNRSAPAN